MSQLLFSHVCLYAALAGTVSHPILRRKEPNVLWFVSELAGGSALLLLWTLFVYELSVWRGFFVTIAAHWSFLAGLTTSIVVYRLSPWHPLAHYPGPLLAKVSKLLMVYVVTKGDRPRQLESWHAQYGPWLRIGPNELSVNLPAAQRPLYNTMFRSKMYQASPGDCVGLVTTLNREEHAHRLVAWNKAFDSDSLKHYRSLAQERTTLLLEMITKDSQRGSVNASRWLSFWAMDIVGDMGFGGGFETLRAGADTEGWMDALQNGVLAMSVFGQVPWMRDILGLLPMSRPMLSFVNFCGEKVKQLKRNKTASDTNIISIIQDEGAGGPRLSEQETAMEASFVVVAGSDTTYQATTAFLRYVVADPHIHTRLRVELDDAFEGRGLEDMDVHSLNRLPYLDACVNESLRIMPPVPAGSSRTSGATGETILGHFIPPNTTAACPIYALHRDPANFINANQFIPERWIDPQDHLPHDPEAFHPFSIGLGVCAGKQVALNNMKLVAASIIRAFDIEFPDTFDKEKFDSSYKEHTLWLHDPLMLNLSARS